MSLTERDLNRSTLRRQLLLKRQHLGVDEAVKRIVAVQAQHPASPYIALWNRVADFDVNELDTAFASQDVVKATLMRVTLQAVHGDDYRHFREAMESTLRGAAFNARFTASGLTVADADALIPDVMALVRQPRTAAEIEGWLEERLGAPVHPGILRAIRAYVPLLHMPTGGAWSFGRRASYIAPSTGPSLADPEATAGAIQRLVRRYLEGFGPASIADIAQFTGIQRGMIRAALGAIADNLERLTGPNGEEMFDPAGASWPSEDTPAPPRLMAMWDTVLLAYADRSRVIPPEYRKCVIRINGDVLPTLLVDGYVAGVWRPMENGIEATAFRRLPEDTWEALEHEAQSLLALIAERDANPYSRYANWWKNLEGDEVRLLPGD